MERSLTTHEKGVRAEMAIANAAVQHGIGVARPLVDGQRYDLIFDVNGRLLRVQCKWARREGDVLVVRVATCRVTPTRGYLSSTYDSTQIDAFAAYFAELNKVYVLPIEEVAGLSYLHLRLAPARNHQRSLVRMAAEYELGAVAQLEERLAGSQKVRGSSPLSST